MTKKLNKMLGIETKLLTSYHLQTDRQIEKNELRVGTVLKVLH